MVKKTDYDTKVTETENKLNNHNHDKYIDNPEFNKLAVDIFNARLSEANLVAKTAFDDKLSNLNRKITKNKTDHQAKIRYFKLITNTDYIPSWQSEGLSAEAIKPLLRLTIVLHQE